MERGEHEKGCTHGCTPLSQSQHGKGRKDVDPGEGFRKRKLLTRNTESTPGRITVLEKPAEHQHRNRDRADEEHLDPFRAACLVGRDVSAEGLK